jgi:DNA-binding NarL/FixJ family response regulator
VLLVDDHPAVREGLAAILESEEGLTVVGAAASVREAMSVARQEVPDVTMLDYHLPDGNGVELCLRLKEAPQPPVAVLYSAFADERLAVLAVMAGADGVIAKSASVEEICAAVRAAAAGRIDRPALSPAVLELHGSRLEPADVPIFGMLTNGVSLPEIAEVLGLSADWLTARRWAILRRLQDHSPDYGRRGRSIRPAPADGRGLDTEEAVERRTWAITRHMRGIPMGRRRRG